MNEYVIVLEPPEKNDIPARALLRIRGDGVKVTRESIEVHRCGEMVASFERRNCCGFYLEEKAAKANPVRAELAGQEKKLETARAGKTDA